jgi:hypothetical protein
MLFLLPVGGTIRDVWANKVNFDESARRIGIISGLAALIRTSPTEQIYNLLSKISLVDESDRGGNE